jgi:predicted site-specific integrase-resolvase
MSKTSDLLLPTEAARLVGLSRDGLKAAAKRGDLRALTTECGWRLYERAEVERFKAERDAKRAAKGTSR